MLTAKQIYQNLKQITATRAFVVAYSGGVDSHVLLHALTQMQREGEPVTLRAIHINHQLHSKAHDWQQHCEEVCQQLGVTYDAYTVTVSCQPGDSVEAQARDVRYQQLATCLREGESLLTAHHQDDQAETVLMQLLRGSGVKGMASMAKVKPFANTRLLRPLLSYCRSDIEHYALQEQLQWVEDSSNQDVSLERNFIRHHVMPMLKQRWPEAAKTISRTAGHCAAADELLGEYAESDLVSSNVTGCQFSVAELLQLSPLRQRHVVRQWLQNNHCLLPDTRQLETMFVDVIAAKEDAEPCFQWKGWQLRRYAGYLYVMRCLAPHDVSRVIDWDLRSDLPLAELGLTILSDDPAIEQLRGVMSDAQVTVRFRQGGEQIRLRGHQQTKTLKNLMQQWQVPPWLRDRIPLIYRGEELVLVYGYALARAESSVTSC